MTQRSQDASSNQEKRPAWFAIKIKKLEEEDQRKQLEIDALRKQNQMYQAEVENLRNLQTHAGGPLEPVYDTISEAEVVHSARLLNNSIQEAAAYIANSCHFESTEPPQDVYSHETSGFLEHASFLLSLHPKFGIFSTKFQNVLQHIIAMHCFETINSWTFGDDQRTINCFLDRVFLFMKGSNGKQSALTIAEQEAKLIIHYSELPSVKNTWKRLTRSYGKMELSPNYRLDWFRQMLTGDIANVLRIAGAAKDVDDGEIRESLQHSLEQIFQRCLELEQAILGRQSTDIRLILPGPNSEFDRMQMHVLMTGEDIMAVRNKVAFTCEMGLVETADHADGSSSYKVLLPAANQELNLGHKREKHLSADVHRSTQSEPIPNPLNARHRGEFEVGNYGQPMEPLNLSAMERASPPQTFPLHHGPVGVFPYSSFSIGMPWPPADLPHLNPGLDSMSPYGPDVSYDSLYLQPEHNPSKLFFNPLVSTPFNFTDSAHSPSSSYSPTQYPGDLAPFATVNATSVRLPHQSSSGGRRPSLEGSILLQPLTHPPSV
ncbi:hypothetical protein GYMLUDRAFT_246188 [Collybiopsis luxurians FD-317 M1]|uniref:Uncharacterized protein n=1 Tax=Collybiopsis luxurians FD-317 M1 TaxID=944289 RepID=A0A0D0C6K4_9AGAR|nr:hypothetical protein GYMLUDRAFT_246188 [Collybiopsis luxurians FD-317 M1]